MARTGQGKATIYAKIAAGEFPAPRQIGPRAVAWLSTEIDEWIASRPIATGGGQSPIRRDRQVAALTNA